MTEIIYLIFEAVIINTGMPIGYAAGEGEAKFVKLQHYVTTEQIQTLLNTNVISIWTSWRRRRPN
jgi:hypothetical protein